MIDVVWDEAALAHGPRRAPWCGVPIALDELPERAQVILTTLRSATVHGPPPVAPAELCTVHDPALVELLQTAHARWVAEGHLADPGAPDAIPYLFPPVAGKAAGRPATTIRVELGRFATDTLTPIGAGTWEAARAAAASALHAAELVAPGRPVYALTRPPGHHAGPAFFGGSCYLNHAALAARRLLRRGCARVAILDVDAHHGNGTQAVFWDDPAVLVASVHVDPGAGWYPHTVGFADEVDAPGTNWNLPLPPGTGDPGWLAAVEAAVERVRAFSPDALVVSLGVDAAAEDPNSPLLVTRDGFARAGARIRSLGLPTVYVQEGGYVPETLGGHVASVLTGS